MNHLNTSSTYFNYFQSWSLLAIPLVTNIFLMFLMLRRLHISYIAKHVVMHVCCNTLHDTICTLLPSHIVHVCHVGHHNSVAFNVTVILCLSYNVLVVHLGFLFVNASCRWQFPFVFIVLPYAQHAKCRGFQAWDISCTMITTIGNVYACISVDSSWMMVWMTKYEQERGCVNE